MSAEEVNKQIIETLKGLGTSLGYSQEHNTQILTELKAAIREPKPSGGHANKPPTFRGDNHDDDGTIIVNFYL